MPGPLALFLILLAGFGIGIAFYGGLWLTVRALPNSRHALLLTLASFWGRAGLAIVGLFLAMDGSWQRALVCLAGFVVARIVLSHWVPPHNHIAGRGVI